MAYTPTLWAKGDIVTSEKLNKIEQGIVDKVDKVNGKTLSTNDFTNEDKAKLDGLESQIDHLESLVGSPLVASTAAEMTDEDKVYVYTGSETGYQNGNWYYYNGTTWTSGGVYNSVAFETDDTLSTQGMAADAKKTGDELLDLKEGLNNLPFSTNYIDVPITWTRTDQYYRATNGALITNVAYYYQCIIDVTPGEVYLLTGTNYYAKAIYATLDANNECIRYPSTGNTGTVEDIEITIEAGETKLVLQSNAQDRVVYTLKKIDGVTLDNNVVGIENLKTELSDKLPTTSFVNLFNIDDNDVVIGSWVKRDGTLVKQAELCASGYIPIEQNVEYQFPVLANYFGTAGANAVIYVPYYNSNKTYVSFATGSYDGDTQLLKITFTSSSAAYCRINFAKPGSYLVNTVNHNPASVMFTKSPYPVRFIPYGEQQTIAQNTTFQYTEQTKLNPLYGKKAVFLGDSICNGASANDGKSGWAGRIGQNNSMKWWNAGISGGTFTAGLSGSAGVISDVPFDNNTYTQNPDYIIIEGGTNDADLIGSALGATLPEKFGAYTDGDYVSTFDNFTYCGAIEKMFKALANTNTVRTAKVGVIIAQKMGQLNATIPDYTAEHNNRRRYFETLIKLCEKWGVPYLNLWDTCILNPMMPNQYTYQQESNEGKYYTDGQHLTTEGYNYIAPIIEAWMKTL